VVIESIEKLNFYELLNIPVDATQRQIQQAHVFAVATFGPDSLATYSLLSDTERERILARVNEAYNVLSNPTRRSEYDGTLRPKPAVAGPDSEPTETDEESSPGFWRLLTSLFRGRGTDSRDPLGPAQPADRLQSERHSISLSSGHYLAYIRKLKGLDLREVADDTKISIRYLRALESEDYDLLPRGAYQRFILRAYAQALGLDPEHVLEDFQGRRTRSS
jgi:curved DNA-binding protein CbpA